MYPTINVNVTRENKFRVTIKESTASSEYTVIIPSRAWDEGRGYDYEEIIRKKCNDIVLLLYNQLI